MKIGIPKEITPGETRVSMFPALVAAYKKDTHEILIESGAGAGASFAVGGCTLKIISDVE